MADATKKPPRWVVEWQAGDTQKKGVLEAHYTKLFQFIEEKKQEGSPRVIFVQAPDMRDLSHLPLIDFP